MRRPSHYRGRPASSATHGQRQPLAAAATSKNLPTSVTGMADVLQLAHDRYRAGLHLWSSGISVSSVLRCSAPFADHRRPGRAEHRLLDAPLISSASRGCWSAACATRCEIAARNSLFARLAACACIRSRAAPRCCARRRSPALLAPAAPPPARQRRRQHEGDVAADRHWSSASRGYRCDEDGERVAGWRGKVHSAPCRPRNC